MYSWLVGRFIRRQIARMLAGDVRGAVRRMTADAEFVFPGRTSFAGRFRTRPEIEAWLERFVSLNPEYNIRDVLVSGPPWNMRVAWRLSDRIGAHYTNEAMVYATGRWGRISSQRVFLDTERVAEWEAAHPEETGRQLARA